MIDDGPTDKGLMKMLSTVCHSYIKWILVNHGSRDYGGIFGGLEGKTEGLFIFDFEVSGVKISTKVWEIL